MYGVAVMYTAVASRLQHIVVSYVLVWGIVMSVVLRSEMLGAEEGMLVYNDGRWQSFRLHRSLRHGNVLGT